MRASLSLPILPLAVVGAVVAIMCMHVRAGAAAAAGLDTCTPVAGAYGGYGDSCADASADTPAAADFVIVGGGTAGCVLAARLCDNLPDASVVLLERAAPRTEEEDLLVRSPRLAINTWSSPALTESWETEPNDALAGRRLTQLSGKTLGGSSAVNAMQWTKPPLDTFNADKWAFTGVRLPRCTHSDLQDRDLSLAKRVAISMCARLGSLAPHDQLLSSHQHECEEYRRLPHMHACCTSVTAEFCIVRRCLHGAHIDAHIDLCVFGCTQPAPAHAATQAATGPQRDAQHIRHARHSNLVSSLKHPHAVVIRKHLCANLNGLQLQTQDTT